MLCCGWSRAGARWRDLPGRVRPVQGHISGVVDIPNACATLWPPRDIFAFDVMPNAMGPVKHIAGGIDIPMSPDK
jgi:formamidase